MYIFQIKIALKIRCERYIRPKNKFTKIDDFNDQHLVVKKMIASKKFQFIAQSRSKMLSKYFI
jgi:hypothetical protein